MAAFLAWVDFDQADRDRAQRIMNLFGESETRDELGIGAIRDSLSDLMFPGTSTIQTRLRYMLFVPWIYRRAAERTDKLVDRVTHARALEMRLIEALERGGETKGVIGSASREKLQRLPSDIYWTGLKALGIRQVDGSREHCLAFQLDGTARFWVSSLPEAPDRFLEAEDFATDFNLTELEADFMRDRLQQSAPQSLFAALGLKGDNAESEYIWTHPSRTEWSQTHQEIVAHAERLALAIEGAARLYNLELSRHGSHILDGPSGKWTQRIKEHHAALDEWETGEPARRLEGWNLDALWHLVAPTRHRVSGPTKSFVSAWVALVVRKRRGLANDLEASSLVREREMRLKSGNSRFRNPAVLGRWSGNSGTAPLTFRWDVVSSHLRDLASAE